MKFSRNPVTGEMEIYTDEGVYVGIMSTFGDSFLQEGTDQSAEDGGPGSGNFGHKGRPGKRGGSGPGGGKQYRGGRSDIGYFGSRKDWLNGLSGERQHNAARFIANAKRGLQEKQEKRQKTEKLFETGLLTREEADQAIERQGLKDIRPDMSPEEYAIRHGSGRESQELLGMLKEARSWDDTKDRMLNENLSEEERKVYEALEDSKGSWTVKLGDAQKAMQAQQVHDLLEAKAMGVADCDVGITDEMQYALGTKEKPKPEGPDYSWYQPTSYGNMEAFMSEVAGERASYGHRYTPEEFATLNQKFVDQIKYGKPSPNQISYYGISAVGNLRQRMGLYGSDKPTKEMSDRLTDEEKQVILDTINRYKDINSFMPESVDRFEDLTFEDMEKAERHINHLNMNKFRSAEAQKPFKDYILAQEKMLIGAEPTTGDEREKARQQEIAAATAAKEAGEAAREAYLNSPEVQAEREHAKELIEARKKKWHPTQQDTTFSKGLGERYTVAAALMNNCGNVDAQVAWDIHSPETHIVDTTGGCKYNGSSDTVYLSKTFQNGDSIHAPWESLYHEVGHGIDHKAAAKFGWTTNDYFSSKWHNGEFCDTIEKEAKAYIEKITEGAQEEFERTDFTDTSNYKLLDKYYERGTSERYEVAAGRKQAKWTISRKRQAAAYYLNNIPGLERGTLSDIVQAATRSRISPQAGHSKSYFQGKDARENMGTECFAELYAAVVRNPDTLKAMKKHFPKTVECFNQMLKEIAERG